MTRKNKKPRYGLCPVRGCNGQMKPDGIAIGKDYSKLPRYKVTICEADGITKLNNCFKCHKCGHSESFKEEK